MINQLVIGVFGAGLLVGTTRILAPRQEVRVYAVGLLVAALVYVGFSVAARSLAWLLVECLGVVVFGVFALLGTRAAPVFLAMGWGLHGAWDVALHTVIDAGLVPAWYPMACVGFDGLLAVYVAGWLRRAPQQARAGEGEMRVRDAG